MAGLPTPQPYMTHFAYLATFNVMQELYVLHVLQASLPVTTYC